MTSLRIEQANVSETVSSQIIHKLYEMALSVSEPQEGQEDAAYLSGHIFSQRADEDEVKYLAGTISYKGSITLNPTGRFQDLQIDVTDYYLKFVDTAFKNYVLSLGVDLIESGVQEFNVNRFNYSFGNTYENDRGFWLRSGSTNNIISQDFPNYSINITKLDDLKYFEQVTEYRFEGASDATSNLTSITLPYTVSTITIYPRYLTNLKRLIVSPHKNVNGLSVYNIDMPDSNNRQNFEYIDLGDTVRLNLGLTIHDNLSEYHINAKGHTIEVWMFRAPSLTFQDLINGGFDETNWQFRESYDYDCGFLNCGSFERLPINNNNQTLPTRAYYNCGGAVGYHVLPSVLTSFYGSEQFYGCNTLSGIIFTNTVPPTYKTGTSHHFANNINGTYANPNIVTGFKLLVPNSAISTFQSSDIMNITYRNGSIPKNHLRGYTLWYYNNNAWSEIQPQNNIVDFNKVKNAALNNRVISSTVGSEQSTLSQISNPVNDETCAVLYY